MRRMVEKILGRYGTPVYIQGHDTPVRAFLQPVTGHSQSMTRITPSPLGMTRTGQYVYIGPLEPALHAQDVLTVDQAQYLVCRAEKIGGINGPAYQWGMCEKKGGPDRWGLDTDG